MELEEDHQGEPISYDELMDFHYQISNDGWLDRLIEKGSTKEE
ncbi:unnamed protein product [Acidithrix sp. C25]|nr:unnamed protein product [Acidithrix sp. C25]